MTILICYDLKNIGIMKDYNNDMTLTCRPSTRIAPSCFSSFRHRCNEYFWIPKWSATVMAVYLLFIKKKTTESTNQPITDEESDITDNLVYVGLAFLTVGMLFGALWAKEAWGHYWSWDPKETWAAITWLAYLVYVHYRNLPHHRERLALWMLIVSFILLQMCWWGINYLPSAQGSSVHTYSMSE